MNFLSYGRQGRRGINMRWIIALVIAGIGIISYFMKTQVNPTTGEKQRVALTEAQEIALGIQSAPQMVEQMGAKVLDPKRDSRAALVAEVGAKLVRSSPAVRSPYANNFNFYLLDDEVVNAFALPGGQIFITTTLFDQLQNEAQLAGVLGHEIGHVIHRHSAQHMAKSQLGQSIVGAVAVGASGDSDGRFAAAAAQMANQMLQMKYGREDESQSDSTGIDYMAKAGYDPREMAGVMEVLKKASGGRGGPEFLQSHPLPENRLQEIKRIVAEKYPPEQLAKLTKGRPLSGERW
jgi:beta-barrel assembly-enhancing protease